MSKKGISCVTDLINAACQHGCDGMSYCMQYNPRVVVVANRCFRVQCRAKADGKDAAVFSAFVSKPERLPQDKWKYIDLEGKNMVVDEYTGRLLTGLGIQLWKPNGVDLGDSVCGVLAAFIHTSGAEYSDEEVREAAEKMSTVATAAYTEICGKSVPDGTVLPQLTSPPSHTERGPSACS